MLPRVVILLLMVAMLPSIADAKPAMRWLLAMRYVSPLRCVIRATMPPYGRRLKGWDSTLSSAWILISSSSRPPLTLPDSSRMLMSALFLRADCR